MKHLLPTLAWLLFSLSLQAQSDACADAPFIFPNAACFPEPGSTAGATNEGLPGDCAGSPLSVWYQFQASSSTQIITVEPDPGFDLVVGVLEACDGTTRPTGGDCTNAGGAGAAEVLNLSGLTAGAIYYISIHENTGQEATFSICLQEILDPPANDACANAAPLTSFEFCNPEAWATGGATNENAPEDCSEGVANSIWFQFEAVSFQQTVTVRGNFDFDAVLGAATACGSAVHPTGGDCVNATGLGGTEVMLLQDLTAGETYYIQVHDAAGGSGQFDICVTGDPLLPVRLMSFTGTALENANLLQWKTASESNSHAFHIERSADGISGWRKVGELQAAGKSQAVKSYSFEDRQVSGKAFYRLRMIDLGGAAEMSNTIQVLRKGHEALQLAPNPFNNTLTATMKLEREEQVSLSVSDLSGRRMYSSTELLPGGEHSIRLSSQNWPAGWFILQMQSASGLQTLRILKQ